MKILLTGGSGLLGQYLNIELSKHFDLLTCYNSNSGNCKLFNSRRVDITNNEAVSSLFEEFKPDLVIHAAAHSSPVNKANVPPAEVYKINVKTTENIARLCKEHNAFIFYLSTDLVYAGYRGSMLKEDAKLIPVSLYAETKLMGEVKVIESTKRYLILRTALLFGKGLNHSRSFFDTMIESFSNGKKINLFYDQFRTPLSCDEAARMITQLADKDIPSGIINFGGPERVSRVQLGEIMCDVRGWDKKLINHVSMRDVPGIPFVEDVSMNTDKLKLLGVTQLPLSEAVAEALK